MDISKYEDFFHDGAILDIQHVGSNIDFSMYSAEIDDEYLQDDILLSRDGSLQGRLHIEGIKHIIINKAPFFGILKKSYQSATILDFAVTKKTVEIGVLWSNIPYKLEERDYTYTEIEAEKIWWETIPDLEDLYP